MKDRAISWSCNCAVWSCVSKTLESLLQCQRLGAARWCTWLCAAVPSSAWSAWAAGEHCCKI